MYVCLGQEPAPRKSMSPRERCVYACGKFDRSADVSLQPVRRTFDSFVPARAAGAESCWEIEAEDSHHPNNPTCHNAGARHHYKRPLHCEKCVHTGAGDRWENEAEGSPHHVTPNHTTCHSAGARHHRKCPLCCEKCVHTGAGDRWENEPEGSPHRGITQTIQHVTTRAQGIIVSALCTAFTVANQTEENSNTVNMLV